MKRTRPTTARTAARAEARRAGVAGTLPSVLADPAIYPRAGIEPELIETHVSWIALAGDEAYKFKRPVRFAFLDYSTPQLRRCACATELALNRRWAPALYLGLAELSDTPAGPRLHIGPPLGEPAVRMRRFDRGLELDALVAAGRVVAEELATLGADLAAWQAASPRVAPGSGYGRPGAALTAARDNLDALAGVAPERSVIRGLAAWIAKRQRRVAPLLARRRAAGRVRECHGDLHTGNVVRLAGRLTPFDGIDFDPSLRWIDVASDVAFLVMDLERQGRADLAAAFLDRWLDASGDYQAAAVLPWFLAYRALVRAKVEALRAAQLGRRAGARASRAECAVLLRHAQRYARRPRGCLIITCGPSGSGKSRLAAALVPLLPALRLRSDVERKRLAGLAPLARSGSCPDQGLYAPALTRRTYARLATAAGACLRAGFNVIVDAAFLDPSARRRFAALAAAARARFAILECTAPASVLRARVGARRADPSEATLAVLERQLARVSLPGATERRRRVLVDTAGPIDVAAIAAALTAAAARPGGWRPAAAPGS